LHGFAGLFLFALFTLIWSPIGSVSPASAQTVTCTGVDIPTTNTLIAFDSNTNNCAITNVGGLPTTAGVLFFQTRPVNAPDAYVSALGTGAATIPNDSLTVNGVSGVNAGANLVVATDFADGSFTATATQTFAAGLCTMTVSITRAGAASLDITAASVTCPTGGSGLTNRDRSNITGSLSNSLNQVGGSIFDDEGVSIFGGGSGSGLSLTPTGLGVRQNTQSYPHSPIPYDPLRPDAERAMGGIGLAARDAQGPNKGFNFRMDLQQMLANGAKDDALGLGAGRSKAGGQAYDSPFNAWVSGRYVDFDDDQRTADRDGHLWWLTVGSSYALSETSKIGAFGRYREGQVDSTALQADLESQFYGGGLFAILGLPMDSRLLVSGLYEHGDSDITIAGAKGDFDSDQWTFEARIDKRFQLNRYWVEPRVNLLYTNEDNDNFTDSAGNAIQGQELELGRLTYGPTIGTTIAGSGAVASVSPQAHIRGIWDFQNDGSFTTSTGAVFSTSETGLNLGGGLDVTLVNGLLVTFGGDWFTYDTELQGWSLRGGIGSSLAALGLGNVSPTGFVKLDMGASQDGLDTKARLTIPLGGGQ